MHDIQTEFFVRVSRTSFLDGELGSSVMGLSVCSLAALGSVLLQRDDRVARACGLHTACRRLANRQWPEWGIGKCEWQWGFT